MPGKDLNYRITVDQSAGTSGIRDFSRTVTSELRKVDKSLEDTSTASQRAAQTLTKMADAAEAELRQAAKAAEALAAALGPEMAAKLGQNGIAQAVGDLNRMGVAFADIEADADGLAAAMRRVDEVQVSAADAGLGNLNGRLNDTDDAAVKARNSLANMFGNTAQDASSLFGNLGSLGVGIGQLAEGAADAALGGQGLTSALKSTALMAGPIAGLAAVLATVGALMSANARAGKQQAEAIKLAEQAARAGGNAVDAYADQLAKAEDVTIRYGNASIKALGGVADFVYSLPGAGSALSILGEKFGLFGKNVESAVPLLEKAGVTAEQWSASVVGAGKGYGDLATALAKTSLSVDEQAALLEGLTNAQDDYTTGKRNAAQVETVFGDTADDTTDAVERQSRALDRAKTATDDLLASVEREADARERAASALKDQADALNDQIDAAARAADSQVAAADALVRFNDVLHDHKASAADARDAATALSKAQLELADDQAAAAGTTLTATQRVDNQNASLLAAAKTARGPARQAILDYVAALNGIEPTKVTEVIPNIDDMSLDEAMAAMAGVSATRTAAVIADAHTDQYERDMAQATRDRYLDIYARLQFNKGNSTAARILDQSRPTSVAPAPAPAGVGALRAAPTDPAAAAAMPAGGAVVTPWVIDVGVAPSAPTALTLDMRGAILGSRYDIVRTVRTATRDGVRLAGRRHT